jgi:Cysteine-rich CPCC
MGRLTHYADETPTAKRWLCPCCGYRTLDERPPGTYEICPVCFWEDDNVQFDEPDREGAANGVSLNVARRNFRDFGAMERRFLQYVRAPRPDEFPESSGDT